MLWLLLCVCAVVVMRAVVLPASRWGAGTLLLESSALSVLLLVVAMLSAKLGVVEYNSLTVDLLNIW